MQEKLPIIFVTGIGQTWSMLKSDTKNFWNMVPNSKEILLKEAKLKNYIDIASLAVSGAFSLLFGGKVPSKAKVNKVINFLLRYVIVDENGNLPPDVDVKIYGARPFSELRNVDLVTEEYTDDYSKSMIKRIYKDIPCEELARDYGADRIYCFNYSTFSDLYDNAKKLRTMIEQVLKRHPESDKVVLVPMSMGATVVNAYLDEYYKKGESVGDNLVKRVVSIVGAWDGSDGLADLLEKKFNKSFYELLKGNKNGNKTEIWLSRFNEKSVKNIVNLLVDSFIECVLLRVSSFAALIPNERYLKITEEIFTEERLKDTRIQAVKKEYDRYYIAQRDLKQRLYDIRDKSGVEFSFLAGYNLDFGGVKSDFEFLSYIKSAGNTNTDSVIQISSTAPGTYFVSLGKFVPKGTVFQDNNCKNKEHNHFSPDLTICANTSYFPENSWYFEGQEHELGTNNTALKLAIGIAKGDITDVHNPDFPQFNSARNITKAKDVLKKAKEKLSENIPESEKENIILHIKSVEDMLNSTLNDRIKDAVIVEELEKLL